MKKTINFFILFIVFAIAGFYFFNKVPINNTGTGDVTFSHYVHTKQHNIKCKICHQNYEKQERAGIPTVETCAICHSEIINPKSEKEKKINEYVTNNKPIVWLNYYRVPDYAYFSHKRHVKIGNLDCVLCHGDMTEQKSKELTNFQPFLMDNCVNCHKQRNITIECGNCHH
jgi:hypothetical protein